MNVTDTHLRRFEILREIASGGFGSVFLCRVTQADGFSRVVAVKLLHPQWSENEEVSSRMRDEARLLGLLSHKNIVDVFDLTRLDGRVAVVMEYLEAIDLKSILKSGSSMPVKAILQLGSQVASALDAAFNKAPVEGEKPLRVVHRDIKPSNIMVDAQGVGKVLDFGVARGEFESREAETRGMAFGSFDYMPSERRFMESGGETSDVYSLGAVLFELLSGGEKLGKGKLKGKEHQKLIQERCQALHDTLAVRTGEPLDRVALQRLVELMATMLDFDAEARPMPADVASTLRQLARSASDPTLEEWAESHVPPLLAQARAKQDRKVQNPLVGQTLIEQRTEAEGTPRPVPATTAPRPEPTMPAGAGMPSSADAAPASPQGAAFQQVSPSSAYTPPGARQRTPTPITRFDPDIPKRVRDAAPSRPAITGTQTPAPLRRAARKTPPRPPQAQSAPPPVAAEASTGRGPSPLANVLYGIVWVFGLLVLGLGAVALLIVAWYAGQG